MNGRYEMKYPLDLAQADVALKWAQSFCVPDAFGDAGRYEVISLYFDTRDDRLMTSTLEGFRDRFKVRVRAYSREERAPLFAEIKRRLGRVVAKERARGTRDAIRALLHGQAALLEPLDRGLVFRSLVERLALRPRVWVRYQRQAFTSAFGDGARLTVDDRIEAQIPSLDDPLYPSPELWVPVPTDQPRLLELKYHGAFPAWMDRLVGAIGVRRSSFSKYARAAQAVPRGVVWMP